MGERWERGGKGAEKWERGGEGVEARAEARVEARAEARAERKRSERGERRRKTVRYAHLLHRLVLSSVFDPRLTFSALIEA